MNTKYLLLYICQSPFFRVLVWFFVLFGHFHYIQISAQTPADLKKYRYSNNDSLQVRHRLQKRSFIRNIRPTEKFDLVWNNGFLVTNSMVDTIPVRSASSGTTYLGLSLNYIISPRFLFKFQGGVSYYGFSFGAVAEEKRTRLFTFEGDTVKNKRLRATFIDFPISVAYVLKRDTAKGKFNSMIEAGFCLGYRIGSEFSYTTTLNGKDANIIYNDIPDLSRLKLGLQAKISYGIVGLWVFYRLNDFFIDGRKMANTNRLYPKFSRLEIGFSIML